MPDRRIVVDLTHQPPPDEDSFWDALAGPLGLPEWFGRNLDAWTDTVEGGTISEVVDSYEEIVIRIRRRGLFDPGNDRGSRIIEVIETDTRARFEVVD